MVSMPKCTRCEKRTFDGTKWMSQTEHPEFNGKYLCKACRKAVISIPTTQANKSTTEENLRNQMIMSKPTSAYNFSMVGGSIGTFISLVLIAFGVYCANLFYSIPSNTGMGGVRRWWVTTPYGTGTYVTDPYFAYFGIYLGIGLLCLLSAVIIIHSARKMMANPAEHTKWGNTIIISSIMGLGTIFGLIGGILAVSFKPDALNNQSQPITKICLHCGTVVNNSKFCPECGKEAPYSAKSYSIQPVS